MESLPGAFWILYAIIILLTLVTSLFYWIKRRYSGLAAVGIIFSLFIPLVSFVYTAQRSTGNEYQYMKEQLLAAEWIAILILIGYVFIVGWTVLVAVEGMIRLYRVPFVNRKVNHIVNEKLLPLWGKCVYYLKIPIKFMKRKLPHKKKDKINDEAKREVQ